MFDSIHVATATRYFIMHHCIRLVLILLLLADPEENDLMLVLWMTSDPYNFACELVAYTLQCWWSVFAFY